MIRTVFLLSDFGISDTYIAQMKSVILSQLSSETAVVDLTHSVKAGSVIEGAFHLHVSSPVIPAGSVVVAVVDPGVGTSRRGVVCSVNGSLYTGPDNGLFGLLPIRESWRLPDPPPGSSGTFHGRDVFAPAGARLIIDPGWVSFLEPVSIDSLVPSVIEMPVREESCIEASVAHVDSFGNVILWLSVSFADGFHPSMLQLPSGKQEAITEVSTYERNPGILYLPGSQGLMEIAIDGGDASEFLGLTAGDRIGLKRILR